MRKHATFEDYQLWQFYFNFERPVCENEGLPAHNVLYGAEFLSEGPLEGGSDFKLLRLTQRPPASWRPYYNGWNRLDEPAHEGVAIHHPGGDAKKISTFNETVMSSNPIVSGQQMAENSAWRVTWKETENGFGVTQGGSSGSPLFNQDGLIVGTLTGGSSNCNATHNPDFFGKISYHWDQNGDAFHEQIAGWLDPLNTGATQLPGYDPNMPNHPPPGFVKATPTAEQHIALKWYKPGHTPNKPGWHTYATSYSGKEWYGPERATLFHTDAFNFSYPATISKVSHVFFETASNPWPSDEFRFVIYDHTATNILYQSEILHAEHLTEIIHEPEEHVVVNKPFYVAVEAMHPSGRPSSAFERINLEMQCRFTETGLTGKTQVTQTTNTFISPRFTFPENMSRLTEAQTKKPPMIRLTEQATGYCPQTPAMLLHPAPSDGKTQLYNIMYIRTAILFM